MPLCWTGGSVGFWGTQRKVSQQGGKKMTCICVGKSILNWVLNSCEIEDVNSM